VESVSSSGIERVDDQNEGEGEAAPGGDDEPRRARRRANGAGRCVLALRWNQSQEPGHDSSRSLFTGERDSDA
jgi:hypothetical protein